MALVQNTCTANVVNVQIKLNRLKPFRSVGKRAGRKYSQEVPISIHFDSTMRAHAVEERARWLTRGAIFNVSHT